jgi:hypothetical protein
MQDIVKWKRANWSAAKGRNWSWRTTVGIWCHSSTPRDVPKMENLSKARLFVNNNKALNLLVYYIVFCLFWLLATCSETILSSKEAIKFPRNRTVWPLMTNGGRGGSSLSFFHPVNNTSYATDAIQGGKWEGLTISAGGRGDQENTLNKSDNNPRYT